MLNASNTDGEYGVTEAYKTYLYGQAKALLTSTTTPGLLATGVYYAPEKALAKEAIEKAMADIKAATTAKDAYKVYDTLTKAAEGTLAKLLKTAIDAKYELATLTNDADVLAASVFAGRTSSTVQNYTLEGYFVASASNFTQGRTFNNLSSTLKGKVMDWMFDNNYRTEAEVVKNMGTFVTTMKANTAAYLDAQFAEWTAIDARVTAIAKKYNSSAPWKNTLVVADLDEIESILVDIEAYEDKYALDAETFTWWHGSTYDFVNAAASALSLYFNQYYAEVYALPGYTALVDADKANVLALYKKLHALTDNYEYTQALASTTSIEDIGVVDSAAAKFYAADKAALGKLTFNYLNTARTDFDATEKNVAAVKAAREAYDAIVANYFDTALVASDLRGVGSYEVFEAALLAAEHNQAASAGYVEASNKIDTAKVKAYLNNAKVTVKSTKLAAKKVRVNATIDTQSMYYLLEEMADGCTVEYKFYFKAPGKSFKLTKTKDVNYITYTSKSLKAGKNSFRVGVVVKDADGNVVAEKSYKASTLAYRTIK